MLTNRLENGRTIKVASGGPDHHNAIWLDRAATALVNLAADTLSALSEWDGEIEAKVFIRKGKVTGFDTHKHEIHRVL